MSGMPQEDASTPERTPARDAMAELLDRPLSASDLAEQTRDAAMPLAEEAGTRTSVLLVEVAGERLALEASLVRRVFAATPVHRVPHRTNRVLRGLCNLGGRLVLSGSIEALLDLSPAGDEPATATARRTLLIGGEAEVWAIEVDRVVGVARIDPAAMIEPPATIEAARDRYTRRLLMDPSAVDGSRRIALLDGERLLAGLARSLA